jgi:hypothetical protein
MIEILGDVNNDGKITNIDVVLALKMIAGLIEPSARADVDLNGYLELTDVQAIIKHLTGESLIIGVIE